jgi:glycosyltransferase involved in cell wall biosynthesis
LNKYKVLVIPAWFDPANKQEGVFIHEFCETMQRNGYDITLLHVRIFSLRNFFEYFRRVKFNFSTNYRVITIRQVDFFPKRIFKNGISFFKERLLTKVLRKLKDINFEIIHFQSLCNNITPFLGYRAAKIRNVPYLLTEHYTSYKEAHGVLFEPYTNEKFVSGVIKESHKNIAVSKFAARQFQEYFKANFECIPNIIASIFFNNPFLPIEFRKDFKFIFIGALISRKGILELLKAFHTLSVPGINITLTIIGEGDLNIKCQQFVTAHHLQGKVQIMGGKTELEILNYLDGHHCLVSASEIETFGLVIAESFLRGRPVVAVDSGAVSEIVTSRNGILIRSNDKTSGLVKAMNEMIRDYPKYDQFQIAAETKEQFNEMKIVRQYDRVYESALKK